MEEMQRWHKEISRIDTEIDLLFPLHLSLVINAFYNFIFCSAI